MIQVDKLKYPNLHLAMLEVWFIPMGTPAPDSPFRVPEKYDSQLLEFERLIAELEPVGRTFTNGDLDDRWKHITSEDNNLLSFCCGEPTFCDLLIVGRPEYGPVQDFLNAFYNETWQEQQ